MRTISRLFDSHDQAARAVEALQAAGIARHQISIIGPYDDEIGAVLRGPGTGAALGAAAGLLAGLGAFDIPGIDPLGAGWLASALVGAALGCVAGRLFDTLSDIGKQPDQTNAAPGVILVLAHVDERQADTAQAVLGASVQATQSLARAA
ncbi:hypothetical protein NKI48_23430 [Mesorhizobium sp. M0644]|uniref:hypothetical protein n=1 Tax=unclassified Mesorhizobium TaxID=325217 RepID=UPI0003CEF477|nr:hypothetical protein [Mesorhizobium sp. LSJC280B00]ESW84063.1 hypothetical protein X772_17755 [Mesorhizobium sp. LSJC280B00]